MYSALRGLKLIYVPYGHTCRPAKGKDHTREGVGSSDLEFPLMHDFLENPCEVHLESGYPRHHQHCSIPGNDVISSCGGKAETEEQPQELCDEREVGLLDGPLWLSDPIGTLSILTDVRPSTSWWSLSVLARARTVHPLLSTSYSQTRSDGGPRSICTLAVEEPVDRWQGIVNLHAPDSNLLQ